MSGKASSRHGAVSSFSYQPKKISKRPADKLYQAQRDLYREAWTQCSEQIHVTLASLHDASLRRIVQFVDDSASQSTSLLSTLSGRQLLRTGLIIGASPGSSDLLFNSLCRQLSSASVSLERTSSAPCVVSRISSSSCRNVKSALRALISGFIGAAMEEEDSDDEVAARSSSYKGKKRSLTAPEDMQNLLRWYQSHYAGIEKPTLVWLLEDLESMDAQVLDTMIHTCSRYLSSLPIVFLLGVATSANALGKAVPRSTMNTLDTANFFVEPGVDAFNALIRGLFIDSGSPISIGPKVYDYILKTFQDLDHSIDGTISYLQYIYMNHFERPFSLFTLPTSSSTHSLINQDIRESISEMKSVSKLAKDSQELYCLNPNSTKAEFLTVVEKCRLENDAWQVNLGAGMAVLRLILSHWGRTEVESDLIASILDGKFISNEVTGTSADQICSSILQSNEGKFTKFLAILSSHLDLQPFDDLITPAISAAVESMQALALKPKNNGRQNFVNSNANFVEGSAIGVGDKAFSALVKSVTLTISNYFKGCFRPFTDLLLHEIWYSNSAKSLSEFHPSILLAFQRALKPVGDEIESQLDIKVAYNLYKETGRLINLSDWFGAFEVSTFTEPLDEDVEEEKSKGRKRARFIRCLGDLAHVGFIVPTLKKDEHVAKNVF